jgi:arylesterase / paraoxonase
MSARLAVTFLVAITSVLLYTQSAQLWRLAGRVEIDKARLVRWENSTQLNNHDCKVIDAADACEDVKIHFASRTAFLACGDSVERTHWYPCAGVRTVLRRAESSFREKLFTYDVESGTTTELRVEGLEGDFITHGIDVLSLPGDASQVGGSASLAWSQRLMSNRYTCLQ